MDVRRKKADHSGRKTADKNRFKKHFFVSERGVRHSNKKITKISFQKILERFYSIEHSQGLNDQKSKQLWIFGKLVGGSQSFEVKKDQKIFF